MKLVQFLLQNAADPHQSSPEHGSVLHANAISKQANDNNMGVFCLFLRLGVDVNQEGGFFGTALQAAAFTWSIRKVQRLLEHGARVTTNIPESRFGTALHAAASSCSVEIVQMLLDKGADLHAKSGIRGTAILAAAAGPALPYHYARMVKFLLEKGANINDQCEETGTILQSAMVSSFSGEGKRNRYGEEQAQIGDVLPILLKHKADINAINPGFGTALHVAARHCIHVVKFLLENGADVNLRGGEYETPLIAAMVSMAKERAIPWHKSLWFEEVVRVLLAKGVDVNARSEKHGTALEAAGSGKITLYKVKKLIKQHMI
jgi:ankyrin repeat protein